MQQCLYDIGLVWPSETEQAHISNHWPLIGVIVFSWCIAFFEYCCQVPANRIGFQGDGGSFSLIQLTDNNTITQ